MFLINDNKIYIRFGLILSMFLLLPACSHNGYSNESVMSGASGDDIQTKDRFVNFNRDMYEFNVGVNKHLLKPVARAYKTVTPDIVDTSITNFFSNLGDISNTVNNIFQGKPGSALNDVERFIFNSTFGIAGLFDIATEMGLEKHHEDFGQTLAVWGVDSGPYIMLPILGPSTLRDATAKLSVDSLLNPVFYSEKALPLYFLEKLDKYGDLLSTEDAFKDFSDDQYIALKDAWLQRREYLIRDGKVDEKAHSDLIDELESLDDN